MAYDYKPSTQEKGGSWLQGHPRLPSETVSKAKQQTNKNHTFWVEKAYIGNDQYLLHFNFEPDMTLDTKYVLSQYMFKITEWVLSNLHFRNSQAETHYAAGGTLCSRRAGTDSDIILMKLHAYQEARRDCSKSSDSSCV